MHVKTLTLKVKLIVMLFKIERHKCNRCGKSKLDEESIISFDVDEDGKEVKRQKNEIQQIEEAFKLKKPFVERPGDWVCIKCKNLNFAFRIHCNRCKTSKQESNILMKAYFRGENISELESIKRTHSQQQFTSNEINAMKFAQTGNFNSENSSNNNYG